MPKVLRVSMRYLGMGEEDIPVVFVRRVHRIGMYCNTSYASRTRLRSALLFVSGKIVEDTETDWTWVANEQ